MSIVFVSPAEPQSIKLALGERGVANVFPEEFGADFLFPTVVGRVAIQRKEVKDLISSVEDGRLAKELAQLRRAEVAILIVEGWPQFTSEGFLINKYIRNYTKRKLRNLLRSCALEHGVYLERTESPEDTVKAVFEIYEWLNKGEHMSLYTRPKSTASDWGMTTNRDFGRWVLQGFPGIGPKLAESIYDHFGRVPLCWDCTKEELMKIDGIGKDTAEKLLKTLQGEGSGKSASGSGKHVQLQTSTVARSRGDRAGRSSK